jgi:hypothetical protein
MDYRWPTSAPSVYLEYFLTASWLEHRRQHERVTNDDRQLQDSVRELHIGSSAPWCGTWWAEPPR